MRGPFCAGVKRIRPLSTLIGIPMLGRARVTVTEVDHFQVTLDPFNHVHEDVGYQLSCYDSNPTPRRDSYGIRP